MLITQSILELIREEFKEGIKAEFDPEYSNEVMAIYDRATALALGKRFMSDKPMREVREHPTLRGRRIHQDQKSRATNASVQTVLDACQKVDSKVKGDH